MNVKILEILLYFPNLILIVSILVLPFYINKKIEFHNYNKPTKILFLSINCLMTSAILTFTFAYWSIELSTNILLKNLGYNENGMNEYEYYKNVELESLNKAKEIRESQMGIGWPLKVIFMFVIFTIPYEIIMSVILGIRNKKDYR